MNYLYEVGELEQVYLSTIKDNLSEIETVLAQLGISSIPVGQFADLLSQSSKNLTGKWQTGRKVVRTQIARMLIPSYPSCVTKLSLTIDAIINLLDELLDEILLVEQKAVYILEMVRVLSLLNHLEAPPRFQRRIASYFNKCICIVIPEVLYKDKIRAASSFDERLEYSIHCYDAKSLDMDVFMELPLVELYGEDERVDALVSSARIHRAVALINKDYRDLQHDRENDTETPLVLLAAEGEEQLRVYLNAMMGHYEGKSHALVHSEDNDFSNLMSNIRTLVTQELCHY